jgi:amino acid transporter
MASTSKHNQLVKSVSSLTPRTRPMSVFDGFIYNFLAMGVIFPWVYMWGPAAFPGGKLIWGIVLTFFAQIPIGIAYAYLASSIPGDGGDFLYQKRAFGKIGTISVLSGFVVWFLQWIAISGWLFTTLGLAPLFLSLGAMLPSKRFTMAAIILQSRGGVMIISLLLVMTAVLLLVRGLRLFALIQRVLFAFTLAAVIAIIVIFLRPASILDANVTAFVSSLIKQLGLDIPIRSGSGFVNLVSWDAYNHGFLVTAPSSFLSTLGMIPIVWTSLQWCSYSVEHNNQIANSNRIRNQLFMILGSAICVAILLAAVAASEERGFGRDFLRACAGAYWSNTASPELMHLLTKVFQPFPSTLAMASSGNIIMCGIIAVGFLANSFQITCNCFIGVSRIVTCMYETGDLTVPGLSPRTDEGKIMHAYWIYLWASIPIIAGYGLIADWTKYTLGATFACGYVFVLSSLAAVWFTKHQLREPQRNSARATVGLRIVYISGVLGTTVAVLMLAAYAFIPSLGLHSFVPFSTVVIVLLISTAVVASSTYMGRRNARSKQRGGPTLKSNDKQEPLLENSTKQSIS